MNYKEIGENIKIYRNKRNFTQQTLADKVGVTWEMISKYERGVSSPLQKIDYLAKALSVETRDLLESYTSNKDSSRRIPLFTSAPANFEFTKTNCKFYYPCPDWIYEMDNDCFALDAEIVKNETVELKANGVLFVVNKEVSKSNIYLVKEDTTLIAKRGYEREALGKIIAEEARLT